MADPTVIATATVTVLAAIGTVTVLIINALSSAKRELITLQHDLAEKAKVQGEKIHDLVNGNAHAAAEKLASVEAQLASLRKELTRLQEQRVEDAKTREGSSRRRDDPR